MKINVAVLLVASVLLNACSNKDIYNKLRNDQRRECEKQADEFARQRCFERAGSDYQSYKCERDKLLDENSNDKRG